MNRDGLLVYLEGVYPDVHKGVVTLSREDGTKVLLPKDATAYLDEHPEGADRGGYVPYVELPNGSSVFFHEELGWT